LDLLKHNPKDIPAKTQVPAQAAPIQEKKTAKPCHDCWKQHTETTEVEPLLFLSASRHHQKPHFTTARELHRTFLKLR